MKNRDSFLFAVLAFILLFISSVGLPMRKKESITGITEEDDEWLIFDFSGSKKKKKAGSALMEAVVRNQMEIVKLLVEKGADVNYKDAAGWTAMHWAIHYKRPEMTKFLIDKGAEINVKTKSGKTPLSIAIKEDLPKIAKILIENGADVNPRTDNGKTIVSLAIREEYPELAENMIKKNVFLGGAPRGKEFPLVIAHRGNSAHYPENTIAGFKSAIDEGAKMIELDVMLTSDNEVVVFHDETLDRTTNGSGKVSEKKLKELKELDAGSWFKEEFNQLKIPTLKEVFKALGKKVIFNVEVKHYGAPDPKMRLEKEIVDLIEDNKLESSVVISCFDYQILRNIRDLNDKVNLAVLSETDEKNINVIRLVKAIKACSYNPDCKYVTQEMINNLHKAGIMVMPWAYEKDNTPENMKKFIYMGCDGFFANDPAALKKIVDQYHEDQKPKKKKYLK